MILASAYIADRFKLTSGTITPIDTPITWWTLGISIGGLILLLLWLYWSGVALLLGAEIDSTIEQAGAELAARSEGGIASVATLRRDA